MRFLVTFLVCGCAAFQLGLFGKLLAQPTFPQAPALGPASADALPASTSGTNAPPVVGENPSVPTPATVSARAQATALSGTPSATNAVPEPAQVAAASLSSMDVLDDKNKLAPGDRVSFRVVEDQEDPVSRFVTDTGEIDFPYIGRLPVEGRTCREVALQVKKALEARYYYQATVILGLDVINHTSVASQDTVWIVGQVRQVGPQALLASQNLTVSQVILRAGGFGDFADQRRVRLVHRGEPSGNGVSAPDRADSDPKNGELVDVKAIFQGQSRHDPVVMPNDLIIVPKRLVNF